MRGDGKGKFYRTLNLDKDSRDILKFFNKIKKKMLNDKIEKKENHET